MELLIVRHGPAGDKAAWARKGRPDAERPLTLEGRKKTRKAMRGLAELAPKLAVIASSPLLRALETAQLLEKAFPKAKRVVAPELSPESHPPYALELIARFGPAAAVVGHEPHLSCLLALAVGADWPICELKKGGAALVEFHGKARAGEGRIRWLLTASQLGSFGR